MRTCGVCGNSTTSSLPAWIAPRPATTASWKWCPALVSDIPVRDRLNRRTDNSRSSFVT